MNTYAVAGIVEDVRVALDENTSVAAFEDSEGNVAQPDTLEMEDIIRSKIADGINTVRLAAPLRTLELTRTEPSVRWRDAAKGIGEAALPSDFLRLALFKMSDWDFGVQEAISPADESYRQQWSEFQGVRGNPNSPVIALSGSPSAGDAVIEFFSSDSTDATATLLYIRRETDMAAESYSIEEGIYRAVVLKTAALVAGTYSMSDQMTLLNTLCAELIGNA